MNKNEIAKTLSTLEKHLSHWKWLMSEGVCEKEEGERTIEALEMSISLLLAQIESGGDLIRRESALICLTGENLQNYKYDELIALFSKRLKALPSIKPQVGLGAVQNEIKHLKFTIYDHREVFDRQDVLNIIDKYMEVNE